jgi:hypothetical protein
LALMVVVVVAAIDLAVARAIVYDRPDVVNSVVLSALVLQLALYRLIRRRGLHRAFWAGFLGAGLAATSSFALAIAWPRMSATVRDQATGSTITITSSGAPLARIWYPYLGLAEECLGRLPDRLVELLENGGFPSAVADALIAFAPQLLVSLTGGVVFLMAAVFCGILARPVRRQRPDRLNGPFRETYCESSLSIIPARRVPKRLDTFAGQTKMPAPDQVATPSPAS